MGTVSGARNQPRVLAELTLRLAFTPERGWPRLAAAHASGEPLPSPLRHAVTASFLSVMATGIGWAFRPGTTYAGTVLQLLAAVVGYVGGAALPVVLAPMTSGLDRSSSTVTRYASAAVLPVALSGLVNIIPLLPLSFALALAGAALSAHSGWIGASAMLALEGQARKRAAAGPTGMAVGLVLTATLARAVLPP